jgi:hypothetical protein
VLAFQSPKEQLQPPQDVLVFDRTQNVSIISMQIGMSIPWFQFDNLGDDSDAPSYDDSSSGFF